MALNTKQPEVDPRVIQDPPLAKFLFGNSIMGIVWLAARLFIGYQWVTSGWGKVNNPKWMDTGEALKGFWVNAVKVPEGAKPPITFDWYRSFLQFMLDNEAFTWFGKVIAVSELLIGIALIIGLFTGLAAFGGAMLNFNFMLAGTASTNPLLFALAIGLMLAWKVAGYFGLDRYVLPLLGTPWQPGRLIVPDETRRVTNRPALA